MGKIIGIDLGTSTSEVSVFENGKSKLIENDFGSYITPSVVGLDDNGNIIVGQNAKDQMLLKPDETILEIKRKMGSSEKITLGDKNYSPIDISSYILKYLYEYAKDRIDDVIDGAVITVPAYFNDEQRKATVAAGELADINVLRIINEPTAASLDYGLENIKDCKNIMIFDLGGGTLDVTVLEMFEGVIDVKASSGNNQLGGKDFDQALINYMIEKFTSQYNIDITNNTKSMMRLKIEAEKCKISLSKNENFEIVLPFFAEVNNEPVSFNLNITKSIFENLINDKIVSTKNQIDLALNDAKLTKDEIDLIILVGGSTKIPLVKNFLKNHMNKNIVETIDPDLAVAKGAAIQGALINNELSDEHDILITDVCPYTLGIETMSFNQFGLPILDVFEIMIPRNTTIPVTLEKDFITSSDNQTEVEIKVYQGDNKTASKNNPIGDFLLSGIPINRAGQEKIIVKFSYDKNGILNVKATIASTNKDAEITLETTGIKMEKEVDIEKWKESPKVRKYRAIINKAQRLIDNDECKDLEDEILDTINDLKRALLLDKSEDELNELKDELSDIIYEITED
jgi:molecular chaperone DnaK